MLVAWFLHTQSDVEVFDNGQLRRAFREAHREPPDVTVYLPRMATRKPPLLLKTRAGYRLNGQVRRQLDAKHGLNPAATRVTGLLESLPSKLPTAAEQVFLGEAISCYRAGAFRAAIVMTWNLAFDHLCRWILSDDKRRLGFNAAVKLKYPKRTDTIHSYDDFENFKEFDVIEICRTARLFSKNITEIMREKLKRRNLAAHPSNVLITQHQADDAITDLVNNVVLALR